MVEKNDKGQSVVVIDTIAFKGKRAIDWHSVEEYAQGYKGLEVHCIDGIIKIDSRFADEYCWSKDTKRLKGTLAKAKANAIQAIKERIENASNKRVQGNYEDNIKKRNEQTALDKLSSGNKPISL